MDLDQARIRLDQIDQDIVRLIWERMELAKLLTLDKLERQIAIVQPEREALLLAQRQQLARELGLDPEFIYQLFRALIDESCRVQREVWIMSTQKQRVLTGMRPTGALHLGHYAGALETWLELIDDYECFFLIADYQALGDKGTQIDLIRDSVYQVTLDWLAVGLDPNKSSFVIQSYIPEHAELTMLLSMLYPLGMLERNPTLKTELAAFRGEVEPKVPNPENIDASAADKVDARPKRKPNQTKEIMVGFYTYPVSQAADILLPKADLVAVGEDQRPHIEDTRVVARKFNRTYAKIFPEPRIKVGRVGRLVGLQGGRKMGKSARNAIELRDSAETVRQLVMSMYTDQNRLHPTDPGTVEGNPVFDYHDAFNPNKDEVDDLKDRYRIGTVGDVEVKQKLAVALNTFLDPIRESRAYFEAHPEIVREALEAGTARAKTIAEETMREVREAMRITRYAH